MIELGPSEHVAGRPFSTPDWTRKDSAVLSRMFSRLRTHAATYARDAGDRLDKLTEPDGSVHTIVLPDLERMRRVGDLFGVGFFGQARRNVDHTPIMELEAALIADMPRTAGLVAYYNAFDPDEGWGNLVLFEDAVAERAWGGDPRHIDAVRRSATHYHSIRLHHALAAGGLLGSGPIEIIRTRYLDYAEDPPWRAVREREAAPTA